MRRQPQSEMKRSGIELYARRTEDPAARRTSPPSHNRKTRGGGPLVFLQQLFNLYLLEDTAKKE